MLGRTNLLFVAGDNTSELAFTPDYILTSASGNILKIEYINDLFFVFTEDEKVLYGSDMNNLQTLKNGNEAFAAKHIIYADGVYYLTKIEKTTSKAIIYKSSDLISYEVITLKTGTSSYSYPVHGLFLDSKGEIVAIIEEYKDTYSSHNRYLLIVDTLAGFQEESASFIEVTPAPYNKNTTAIGTRLKKDRIFTYINASSSYDDGGRMISLDGTMSSVDMYSFFALDYFFKLQSHSPSRLYYSLNGTDYISLEFSNDVTDFNAINVFEYGGTIALIYRCTENEETVTKLTTAATPKELIKATASAIPVTIDYGMIANSNVYVDEYAYLGSTGGIVIKGKIDNAETERPDVVVVKGMAAKEALKQANDYTDEKYKNITNEVELHEETTRQYMENAFSATPEGYAALVDTVSENKVKIDTIIEKADLRIKADASGEEIHLIDSAEGKAVEFALYGKARQNTTQGNQLLDFTEGYTETKNGITVSVENGKVKVSGTPTVVNENHNTFAVGKRNALKTNTNYTVKISEKIVGIGVSFESEGTLNLTMKYGNNIRTGIQKNESPSQEVYFNVANNVGSINKTFEIMLNEGSDALPWEKYSGGMASPNPQYPQPIEVSGESGSVEVKSCGKNLLKHTVESKTSNNIEFVVNEDKSITVNGTASAKTNLNMCDLQVSEESYLKVGKEYIISCGNNIPSGTYITVEYYKQSTWLGYKNISVGTNEANFTIDTNADKIRVVFVTNANTNVQNYTFYPMIRLATDTDSTYQPYKESKAIINGEFAGIKVSSGGNYTDQNGQQWICDEVVKYADGSGEKIQRIDKAVFDGSEDEGWVHRATNSSGYRRNLTNKLNSVIKKVGASKEVGYMYCDHYIVISASDTYTNKIGISVETDGAIIIYDENFNTTDISLWKAHLAENPMTLYYELAEPIHTPLTAEEIAEIEKLHTFYPITNISNDFDCGMSVTYNADSKNYIDRMVAEQVASIVANMNN